MPRTRRQKPSQARRARGARGGSFVGRGMLWLLKLVFHPGRLAVLAIVPFALIPRPTWERYLPDVGSDPIYRVSVDEVHVAPAPPAVPDDLVERAFAEAELGKDASLLDASLLPRLAEAFERDPWVKRVIRLRKDVPARIDVELEYRDVVAVVEAAAGFVPIAADGAFLPAEDFSEDELAGYPRVVGVDSLVEGAPGTVCEEPVVLGATRIAAVLVPVWRELGMTAIRAVRLEGDDPSLERLIYVLETAGGSRVIWGHAPGAGSAGEPTAGEKLDRLRGYVASRGPLDGSGAGVEIDLRSWRGVAVRRYGERGIGGGGGQSTDRNVRST